MQDRGVHEVMKLESIELQEPAEERMYRKSEPPYQIGDEAYPLPFVGTWGNLRLLPTFVGGQPGSNRNHKGWREISPRLELHQLVVRNRASPPISWQRAGSARRGAASTVHDGMDSWSDAL